MKTWKTLIGVLICLAAAGTIFASITFNPADGTGFVGKGDVQTVLGLNNAQMQKLATTTGGVTFTYKTTDTYDVVNAWATGNADNPVSLNYHTETVTTTVSLSDLVQYVIRNNPKTDVTGFNLTGKTNLSTIGTVPVVSPTVTFVPFTYTTQEWTGEWIQVPLYDKYGVLKGYKNGDKIYVTVIHETDQLPVDENGNLYTEGGGKAVLSVTLHDSTGGLYVNGVQLIWPPVL